MDRGRQIDHNQNCNAVYLDQYGKGGKTSVKIHNPPGGATHFSLGWGNEPEVQQKVGRKRFDNKREQNMQSHVFDNQNKTNVHTNVRINNNPGGRDQIVFGTDSTNYDDYRK